MAPKITMETGSKTSPTFIGLSTPINHTKKKGRIRAMAGLVINTAVVTKAVFPFKKSEMTGDTTAVGAMPITNKV